MPAQFDLFAPPALPAVVDAATAQLSLFADEQAAESPVLWEAASAAKKPRKRTGKGKGASATVGRPVTISLFDGYDAAEAIVEALKPSPAPAPMLALPMPPARPTRPAKLAPPAPAPTPLTLPFGEDEGAEEPGEPSYRVLFDSTVWALRPDSGDFIHVGTGEIRDEESFTFPTDSPPDYADHLDEWDVSQVRPYR